jgi:hypothetical protein
MTSGLRWRVPLMVLMLITSLAATTGLVLKVAQYRSAEALLARSRFAQWQAQQAATAAAQRVKETHDKLSVVASLEDFAIKQAQWLAAQAVAQQAEKRVQETADGVSEANTRKMDCAYSAGVWLALDVLLVFALILVWRHKGANDSKLGLFRGTVENLRVEHESEPRASRQIWRFDLVGGIEPSGMPSRVGVEMSGWWFEGELINGEVVEIAEGVEKGGNRVTTSEVLVVNNGITIRRIRARNTLRGVVSDFKFADGLTRQSGRAGRSTSITDKIWTFRVQRHDLHGDTLLPGMVEMYGTELSGDVKDGDEVEIGGEWRPGEIVKTDKVLNITTGITAQTSGAR